MRRSLEDNADERNTYIKMALNALSDADQASNTTVLDKTREILKDTFRGEVGAKLATIIANGIQLQHIKQYKDNTSSSSCSSSSASSSSEARATHALSKQAAMDAALKEGKWRLGPAVKRAKLHD